MPKKIVLFGKFPYKSNLRNPFFYHIFIPFILIGSFAILMFGIFTYINSRNLLDEKLTMETKQSLHQIANTIEQTFQSLDSAVLSVVNDPELLLITSEPFNSTDFVRYRQVTSMLNFITTFSPAPVSIDLISFKGNWMLQNNTLQQLNPVDTQLLEYNYFSILESANFIKDDDTEEIQIIHPILGSTGEIQGVINVQISMNTITNLINRVNEFSIPLLITNSTKEIIYQDLAVANKHPLDLNTLRKASGNSGTLELDGNTDTDALIYIRSINYGFNYFSPFNLDHYQELLRTFLMPLSVLSFFLLACVIIIGYIVSNHFSKPILSLSQLLAADQKGGFRTINESVQKIIHSNKSLQTVINHQLEQLKTLFMINLFYGVLDEEEIHEKIIQFNYPSQWKSMCVCAVQLDSSSYSNFKKENLELLLLGINEIMKELLDPGLTFTPAVIDSKTQATILLHQEEDWEKFQQTITTFTKLVQAQVSKTLGISISIGISSPYSRVTQTKTALKQSREALNHRLNKGKGAVIFYQQAIEDSQNKQNFYYPEKLGNALIEQLKNGQIEDSSETINQLLAEIFTKNKGLVPFELSILRLLNDLINLMNFLKIDIFTPKTQGTFYATISEIKTLEEIEIHLKDNIIKPLLDTVIDRKNNEYRNLSEEILHIIQQEFDHPLTLENIAERLHYTPNYLGSIFKKEFGKPFSEYLAFYRHHMAKKWLLETQLTIREISQKLQYNNPQNFIRSFRKLEGMTPGVYRDTYKS